MKIAILGAGVSGLALARTLVQRGFPLADISLFESAPIAGGLCLSKTVDGFTYDTTGGHCHRVTITAADFTTLQNGGSVTLFSCNGGDHEYVLSCGPNPPAPQDPMCGGGDSTGACN